MASLDELKRTFFDECGELLQEMETGLTDLQDGSGTEDTVHAVFRAVHSIKGGAGIFGFEGLVNFAHVFETVLDSVRHGTLIQTPEVFTVLLMSSDMLADLVSMSRSGDAIPAGHAAECKQALEQLLGKGKPGSSDGAEDAGDSKGSISSRCRRAVTMPATSKGSTSRRCSPTTSTASRAIRSRSGQGRRCCGTPTSRSTFCVSCAASASSILSPI
jgi:chemotaxis protein histidine kinase CheA